MFVYYGLLFESGCTLAKFVGLDIEVIDCGHRSCVNPYYSN